MKPVHTHTPGEPTSPEPPDRLVKLSEHLLDPLVGQSGITTTADGRWALYVTVPADTAVPVPGVERQAGGYPVIYEATADEPPRAGPARPKRRR